MQTVPYSATGFDFRRYQNFIVLGLLYAFFYMTRYNMAAAMPQIMGFFGWDKATTGTFETVLPIVYGLSVIGNGPIVDKIGGKRAFLIGAVGVAIMSTLMGASTFLVAQSAVVTGAGKAFTVAQPAVFQHGWTSQSVLTLMLILWAANGYFQAFGALSVVKVNAHWFAKLERGKFAAVFGILIRLGLIFAFFGVPMIASSLALRYVWWIPAVCVTVTGLLVWRFVENSPHDAGYPDFTTGDEQDSANDRPASVSAILLKIFANRAAWMMVVASVMIGFIRRGTIDIWFRPYFAEVYGGADGAYDLAAWGIAVMGIVGGFIFGLSSDRIFRGRRAPVIFFGFIGMVVMLALAWASDRIGLGPVAAAVALSFLSLFVNGAHGLINGAASMDFGGKQASATAAGLFDGMQYLIAAPFTGTGMGYLLGHMGWGIWQLAPIPFAFIGALFMLKLWRTAPGAKAH